MSPREAPIFFLYQAILYLVAFLHMQIALSIISLHILTYSFILNGNQILL